VGVSRLVLEPRTGGGLAHLDQESHLPDVVGSQAQYVTDTLKLADMSAAPTPVTKGVLGAALFAGLGLGAGRMPPRRPVADQRRLPGAAFWGPARLRTSASARQAPAAVVQFPFAIVCLFEFFSRGRSA